MSSLKPPIKGDVFTVYGLEYVGYLSYRVRTSKLEIHYPGAWVCSAALPGWSANNDSNEVPTRGPIEGACYTFCSYDHVCVVVSIDTVLYWCCVSFIMCWYG